MPIDPSVANEFRCPDCCCPHFRSSGCRTNLERTIYCRSCQWSGTPQAAFTAPRPTSKPSRSQRGVELLARLFAGPDFSEPLTRERYLVWFRSLRAELIDLLPELRMHRRVIRECLQAVRNWPIGPFLTPADFAKFVRPLHTCECVVTLTSGQRIRGLIYCYHGGQIAVNGVLLSSEMIADLVCVDRRVSFKQPAPRPDEVCHG